MEQGSCMKRKLIIGALAFMGALTGCQQAKEVMLNVEFAELRQRCWGENTGSCQHEIAKFNIEMIEYLEEDFEKNSGQYLASGELTPSEAEGLKNYLANLKRQIQEERPGWFTRIFFGEKQMPSPARWWWPMTADEITRAATDMVAMTQPRINSGPDFGSHEGQGYISETEDEADIEVIKTPSVESSTISDELRQRLDSTAQFECLTPGCAEHAESRALARALDMSLACDVAAGSRAGLTCFASADDFYQFALAEYEIDELSPEVSALRSFINHPMDDANAARNLDAMAEECLQGLVDRGLRGDDYTAARPGCYEKANEGMTAEARADLEKAQQAMASAEARLEALQARRL